MSGCSQKVEQRCFLKSSTSGKKQGGGGGGGGGSEMSAGDSIYRSINDPK
jgi:hypothetical protein